MKKGLLALSPIVVLLVVYLAMSLASGDFYRISISVAFVAAAVYAVAAFRSISRSLQERVAIFSEGASDKNILYMIWIFILAGIFAATAKTMGAVDATVHFTMRFVPTEFLPAGIFVAACFVSLSIGTSVGTIVALTPVVTGLAAQMGADTAQMVAIVVGGAFFGDNLSFISDTTIAATRTQGCAMRDKFKVNFRLVLPAALVVLAYYVYRGFGMEVPPETYSIEWVKVLPYLVVLATAFMGFNVAVVLLLGILVSGLVGIGTGTIDVFDWFGSLGTGMSGMGELIIITLMAGGMLELIRFNGGVDYIIHVLTRKINGKKGAEMCIGALVAIANVCTANNTIAIITVGPLANDIATKYGVDKRKSASILDTFSCVVQGIIPYGAQMLMAAKLASLSPLSIIEYLYYPMGIFVMAMFSILARWPKKYS